MLAGFLLLSGLSSLSLPGLAPFVSELLVIVGAYVYSPWVAAFAVLGIVLAAIYILLMYQRVFTGPGRADGAEAKRIAGFKDLGAREIVAVAPLLVLVVVLGFYPKPLQDVLQPTVCQTLSQVEKADPACTAGFCAGREATSERLRHPQARVLPARARS